MVVQSSIFVWFELKVQQFTVVEKSYLYKLMIRDLLFRCDLSICCWTISYSAYSFMYEIFIHPYSLSLSTQKQTDRHNMCVRCTNSHLIQFSHLFNSEEAEGFGLVLFISLFYTSCKMCSNVSCFVKSFTILCFKYLI